jgi:lysophospholipase L1-like esterase
MRYWLVLMVSALWAEVAPPSIVFLPDGRVALDCESGALIRYTFEDKDPDRSEGVYLEPIYVPPGRTVRARAILRDGLEASAVVMIVGRAQPSTLVAVTQNRDWKSYDWVSRHESIVRLIKTRKPDLIFIGDSITHFWGGEPADAKLRGAAVWDKYYGKRNAINLGYGWDRTENVLWRLRHGEIEGISPKLVVVMIGTNNTALNTAPEIAAGITAICDELHVRLPQAKILLLGIFPRGAKPNPGREKVSEVNRLIAQLEGRGNVTYLDLGHVFVEADGSILPEVMNDYLHPTEAGYERWASAMEPTLKRLLSE